MDTMRWDGENLSLLDQTKLPVVVEYIECTAYERVAEAIKKLEVRGAPAIGAAAAFGFFLGVRNLMSEGRADLAAITAMDAELRATRPTAVNLFWALDKMMNVVTEHKLDSGDLLQLLEREAIAIYDKDKQVNCAMAKYGAALFDKPTTFLTHCNAGALATVAMGTALGVIRQVHADGRVKRVFADETRPLLQGARLTAFELMEDNIPVTLITDNMAGWVMKNNMIDAVIVGADRIAANGDTANKIGTYSVAVLAKAHQIPFYIAAPSSTFDFSLANGSQIPIEERSKEEVTHVFGVQTAPLAVDVFNPAFDVTPHELITGIITEYGVLQGDYCSAIKKIKDKIGVK